MSERSSRFTIADALALLAPSILLGGLALAGGGFDLATRHIAGVLAWVAVATLLLTGFYSRGGFGTGFRVIAGLLGAFTLLTALSVLWSSSVYASLVEFERLISYLGFFVLAYLVCGESRSRRFFIEGLTLALALVLVLALVSRLFPGTEVPTEIVPSRLSFPLGYWNANGLVFGISIAWFAWLSREGSLAALRWLGIAFIPAATVGLYFTYSRGGAIAAFVAVVCLLFLYQDRLWAFAAILTGMAAAVPVVAVIQSNPTIADNLGGADAPDEGRTVLVALAFAMLGAMLVFWLIRSATSKLPGITSRAVSISGSKRFLSLLALAGVAILAILAILYGGHAWSQFSGKDLQFPEDPKAHFTQLSGAGRYQFNEVALSAFEDNPLLGIGAGNYRFEWAMNRPIGLVAQDAHSLYLESFAELGVLGGMLILAFFASIIFLAKASWKRAGTSDRRRLPLVVATLIALLVGFGIDWFWELAASAALLMVLAGWLAASLDSARDSYSQGRTATRWVVVGSAWVAIAILVIPFIADRYMTSSVDATASHHLKSAVVSAERASEFAPFWAEPHMQLGVIAQYFGLDQRALDEFSKAIDLEPDNWQAWYLRGRAKKLSGHDAAANRDFEQALKRNPKAPQLQGLGVPTEP